MGKGNDPLQHPRTPASRKVSQAMGLLSGRQGALKTSQGAAGLQQGPLLEDSSWKQREEEGEDQIVQG